MRRVRVQADDAACRGHVPGQQVQNPARAAAKIDRGLPWPQANPVQQIGAVGGQLVSLALQPGALARAAAQRVHHIRVLARCRAPSRPDRTGHAASPRNQTHPVRCTPYQILTVTTDAAPHLAQCVSADPVMAQPGLVVTGPRKCRNPPIESN